MVLKPSKADETPAEEAGRLLGVNGSLWYARNPRNLLKGLVAGEGFEPSTFGL